MEETTSLAKAAQSGRVFENYSDLTDYFNNLSNFKMENNQLEDYNDKSWYNIGNNFFIRTLEVPDMWVSNIDEEGQYYDYTNDSEVVKALLSPDGLTVGYVTFSALENAKVNLDGYVLKNQLNLLIEKNSDNSIHLKSDVVYANNEELATKKYVDNTKELPDYSSSQNGKVLKVLSNGKLSWENDNNTTYQTEINNINSDIDQLESLIEKHPDIGIRLKSGVVYANDEELATKKYVDENNTGGGSVIKDVNPIAGYGESSIILSPIKEEAEENKNEAFSKYSTALGLGAVAGSRGYHVLSAMQDTENPSQGILILEGNPQSAPDIEDYETSFYTLLTESEE
jgi:hypothetical protein